MASMRWSQDGSISELFAESSESGSHGDACSTYQSGTLRSKSDSLDLEQRFSRDLESEIIPRLLLAHGIAAPLKSDKKEQAAGPKSAKQDRQRAKKLAQLAIGADSTAVMQYIESKISETMPLDRVLVEVVGGAARYLGELWESDDLDFVEVTIGVSQLQQAIRLISIDRNPPLWRDTGRAYRAAFVPAKGEDHTFGLMMVGEAFRCAGWDVWGASEINHSGLVGLATAECIDLVGFSLAAADGLDQLIKEINTLRESSRSPDLVVMVGGYAFLHNPDLWKSTGADAMALDAIEAIRIGEKLVGSRQPGLRSNGR